MTWIAFTVFSIVLLAGLILMASFNTSHTAQLEKLAKHRKHMKQLNSVPTPSIFSSQQHNDKFSVMLILAGLDEQYEKVRLQWIYATVGGTVVLSLVALVTAAVNVVLAAVVGAILGFIAFLYYLKTQGKMRQEKLARQLPQVLESIASSLKSGSSIMDMFRVISEVAPEPIRSEFHRGRTGFQFNKTVREVVTEMSRRIVSREFKLFVQAVLISQDIGTDLADVVAEIALAVRERFKLRDFVSSITAQGKLTAGVVFMLPFGLIAFNLLVNPSYIMPFFLNPVCQLITAGLILWEFIGIFILSKIVAFEV